MRTRRDFLTPAIMIFGIVIVILALWVVICDGQTHTMPGSNVVPSGASLTIQSGGSLTAAAGSTVTGVGGGNVSNSGTPTVGQYGKWVTATTISGVAVGTVRSDLGLVIGTNVEAWDTDLDVWATKTPYAGSVVVTTGKTFTDTNNLTLSGTDGSTLNVGAGGTLGTAAFTASTAYEVPLTFSTGLTRSTNTVTVNTSQNIATLSNLTTNGFVKTGGAVGTLSVDTATYQASNANLTSWAAITRASGIDTFATTPSSANLRGALTDENGTGAALFSGATAPDFTTGFTIGAAAAAGKIPIGNGTNYVPSTPTWPTAAGTAGKHVESDGTNLVMSTPTYPTTAGAAGYTMRSNATNFQSYPAQLVNSSVSAQSPTTSDVYLAGSNIVVTAGDFKATGQYKCVFDMTKSAGTGAIVITLRVGTAGGTGDAAIQTYTFGAGTSVADFGLFEVIATWRTVGSGTSAVMQGMCRGTHQLATTGLFNNAAGWMVLGSPSPSSGFNSSTATNIGISFNGSTAFAGTTQVVQAQLQQ